MNTMETVIENAKDVKDLMPTEAAQTVVEVATKKPSINVVKTGGIIAGIAALVIGGACIIYSAVKPKKAVEAIEVVEPDCEAETHDDNETDED